MAWYDRIVPNIVNNLSDGYHKGDIIGGIFGFNQTASNNSSLQDYKAIQEEYWKAQERAALQQQAAAQASADKAMEFEANQAAIERQRLTDLSNTAYQRAVADMRKAHLNPALMFSKGFSSASTPSASAASGSVASMQAASVDTDALVSLLRENMSNQSAQQVALINSYGKVVSSLLGSGYSPVKYTKKK